MSKHSKADDKILKGLDSLRQSIDSLVAGLSKKETAPKDSKSDTTSKDDSPTKEDEVPQDQPYSPATVRVNEPQNGSTAEPTAEVAAAYENVGKIEPGVQPASISDENLLGEAAVEGLKEADSNAILNVPVESQMNLGSDSTSDSNSTATDPSATNPDQTDPKESDEAMSYIQKSTDNVGPDILVIDHDNAAYASQTENPAEVVPGEPQEATPIGPQEDLCVNKGETTSIEPPPEDFHVADDSSDSSDSEDKSDTTSIPASDPLTESNRSATNPDSADKKSFAADETLGTSIEPNEDLVKSAKDSYELEADKSEKLENAKVELNEESETTEDPEVPSPEDAFPDADPSKEVSDSAPTDGLTEEESGISIEEDKRNDGDVTQIDSLFSKND